MGRKRLDFDRRSAVSVVPNLLTLGNAVCGFGAIVFIAGAAAGWDKSQDLRLAFEDGKLAAAGWLILLAMIFDALDGKVARITQQVSEIGAQLDSLCDAVTFGVAPAFLVWKTISLLPKEVIHINQKVAWVFAVLYLACVLLRLARFNAEDLSEKAHMSFRGLPSPAAAGVIASLSILNSELFTDSDFRYVGVVYAFFLVIPVLALILGLLMVSKVRYLHILNSVSRGKRTFGFMVQVVFFLGALFILPYYSLPVAGIFLVYAFWPPILALLRGKLFAEETASDSPPAERSAE
jgi:CDP-diacylglycerol--serine O-phosphatidyltransferase